MHFPMHFRYLLVAAALAVDIVLAMHCPWHVPLSFLGGVVVTTAVYPVACRRLGPWAAVCVALAVAVAGQVVFQAVVNCVH